MATMMIPVHQANASHPELPIGVPTSQPRIASMTCVSGWFSAKSRSASGMVSVGTKAPLTNVNGKMTIKPVHCAASMLLTSRPMIADIQEIAREKRIASPNTKTQSVGPETGWKPTRKLTPITIRPDIYFLPSPLQHDQR